MALRLAGEQFGALRGMDSAGWLREVTTSDALAGLKVNQLGTGRIVDFQDGGVSKFHMLDGGEVVVAARQTWAKGADIPSGATLTPGADGNYFDVTGVTTITAIAALVAGAVIHLQFDGSLVITHNATSLILQGGVNLTTAAGDVVSFVSEGSGNWRELSRRLAAAGGGVTSVTGTAPIASSGGVTPAISLNDDGVTNAKLANMAVDTVKGRATAGTGDPEDIAMTAAGRALVDDADAAAQRTTLGLGALAAKTTVATADLDNDAVTNAKLANMAVDTVKGRATAGTGDPEDIAMTAAGRALLDDTDAAAQRATLGLGALATKASVATADLDNDAVTNAKLANMAVDTVKGRATAGTGDPEDIAMTAAGRALLDDADAAAQRTTLGLGAMATVNSPVPVANGGTALTALGAALQVLRVNAGATALEFAAAGGGGAVTRVGGNTTEATTTSTSDVSLLTTTGLSIAAATSFEAKAVMRKSGGAAAAANAGVTLNATATRFTTYWCGGVDQVETGLWIIEFGARDASYLRTGILLTTGSPEANDRTVNACTNANAPTVAITDVILAGGVGNALVTMGADEMHVYTESVS